MTPSTPTPTSPITPRRKRRSTRLSGYQTYIEPPSPTVSQNGSQEAFSHSRRSSQSSFAYPSSTVRPTSSRSQRHSSSRLSIGSNISTGLASNAGLGNLADELEEAWDPDMEDEVSFLHDAENEIMRSPDDLGEATYTRSPRSPRSPTARQLLTTDKPASPSKQWASMGTPQKTQAESLYDGSDYGPSEDDEAFDHIAPMLQRRIHDVEEIIRISSNVDSLSESGGVVTRTTKALRDDLGAQSAVESGITRLVTAYTSMSTHRTHQAREVLQSFHTLNSNTAATSLFDLPPEMLDLLIDDIDALIQTLPFIPESPFTPNTADPLVSLQAFAAQSHEMIALMHSLLDTLTENRQHLLNASRRAKAVRDLVDDLRMDEELVDTSIMLIQAGDWDRRCKERHAGKAVSEVLEGFKTTWSVDYAEDAWRPPASFKRDIMVR